MHNGKAYTAFTDENVLDDQQKQAVQQRLADLRIRQLPYPFASAASIVSDLDASRRERYDAYVGLLVRELGLDFGDSTFLARPYLRPERQLTRSQMHGFLTSRFDTGFDDPPEVFRSTRTFSETVAEFHIGNIDHFHAFSNGGPRFFVLREFEAAGHSLTGRVDKLETEGRFACENFFVLSVYLISKRGRRIEPSRVVVRERDAIEAVEYCQIDWLPELVDGREYRAFVCRSTPTVTGAVPLLQRAETITIESMSPVQNSDIEFVVLGNMHGQLIVNSLEWLRERYGIEIPLVTEHSAQHFRVPSTGEKRDRELQQYFEDGERSGALNGTLRDGTGAPIISSDADESVSMARVLPEQIDRCELRFVVPRASQSEVGWSVLDLISPTSTRSGGGVYWARRSRVNVNPVLPGKRFDDTRSQHDTFGARIGVILEEASKTPGLFWPLYTHLGGGGKYLTGTSELPVPYFESDNLLSLQDCVFGISQPPKQQDRIWLARATTLYDYALILRSIGDHVVRRDADTIEIQSWRDEVLGKTLPRSPAQLYGVTFDVDDPSTAKVMLDGNEIELLYRNPPNGTGSASVSIAESEIRTVVFDMLDPAANRTAFIQPANDRWQWHAPSGTDRAYGRLMSCGDISTLRIPLFGLWPQGAQGLSFTFRAEEGAMFGLLTETMAGGKFYFGDEALLEKLRLSPTARYNFARNRRAPGDWSTVAVPFHDLTWDVTARPGGSIPSHALRELSILCEAPGNRGIDIANLAFFRPRATALARADVPTFCTSGWVPKFTKLQKVFLTAKYASMTDARSASVDQRGYFCFSEVKAGIYDVWTEIDGTRFVDRRGSLVEVSANVSALILDKPLSD
jgi:hypothetical protein